MDKFHINKTQFNVLETFLLTSPPSPIKANATYRWLANDHRIGELDHNQKYWYFTEKDKARIRELLNVQRMKIAEGYTPKQSRHEISKKGRDEKRNSLPVKQDFVLVNAIGDLRINQEVINLGSLSRLGLQCNYQLFESIEHKTIVLVENLETMSYLEQLQFNEKLSYLKEALWLYRGDVKAEQSTSSAYKLFRRFIDTHKLVCFSDFDPKGLEIALSSGATSLLLPDVTIANEKNKQLTGVDNAFSNQKSSQIFLERQTDLPDEFKSYVTQLFKHRRVVKQEHMASLHIPLIEISLVKKT